MDEEVVVIDTVYGDDITVRGDNVYIEYTEKTEYTNNELLCQINENIVTGFGLISGILGMIIGIMCCKELLKIWLT